MRMKQLAAMLVLCACSLWMVGARCVENSNLLVDANGNMFLLGEIFNDTDVQGSEMGFRATLYDASHRILAEQDISILCPGDLAPHSQIAYGVQFAQKNLPAVSFDVRPVKGKALESPPPKVNVTIGSYGAAWDRTAAKPDTVQVTLSVRNDSNEVVAPAVCSATYDASGKVRSLSPIAAISGSIDPGKTRQLDFSIWGQGGATSSRVWVWFPGTTPGTSRYQPVMSDAIAIK